MGKMRTTKPRPLLGDKNAVTLRTTAAATQSIVNVVDVDQFVAQ
jgi:hypothetical protein